MLIIQLTSDIYSNHKNNCKFTFNNADINKDSRTAHLTYFIFMVDISRSASASVFKRLTLNSTCETGMKSE